MKELLEQGYGVTVIGMLTTIGGLTRMILFGYYVGLLKACKSFGKTKNKTIVYIREDLLQRAGKKQGIKSALVYTECRLAECKVCGIRVGFLECILQQSLLVVPLGGVLVALAGAVSGCDGRTVLLPLLVSGGAVAVLLGMDLFAGLREKAKRIRLFIRDYIENSWEFGTEWMMDTEEKTAVKKVKKEKKKEKRVRKAERKAAKSGKRTDKPAKSYQKKNGKAQEEKRRLTEELLRERRQLEARSFAEQRRRQQEEEPVQQVQGEAAVTVCEAMISEEKMPEEKAAEVKLPEEKSAEEKLPDGKMQEEKLSEVKPQEESRVDEKMSGNAYEVLLSEVLTEYLA